MNNENKIVPKLRFPEFVNEGEWTAKNGDKLFDQISNKNHNSDLPILAITQEHGAIPREQIDYTVIVTDKSVESYKVVEIGDFIISLRSFQGGIEYSNYKGLCSPAYIILRKKHIDTIDSFYKQYFKTDLYIKDLNRNLEGIRDGKMVSYKQFSEILLPNPKPAEQQKIASCLSSLDALIAAHTDKLVALKEHKKGLMQQLFPAEGETVPKLRFKEFEGDGEWVENVLDSLTIKISDGIHTTPKYDDNGEYFFINGNNLIDGKIYIDDKTKRVSEHEYIIHKRDLNDSTILLSINGTIGNLAIYSNEKVILGKSACYINIDMEKVDKNFVVYFIQTDFVNNYFSSEQTGSTIKNLSLKSIKETVIMVPPKPNEQQKIANFLSSIDDEIAAQVQKLEGLKEHKKGLMQGLFPVVQGDCGSSPQ